MSNESSRRSTKAFFVNVNRILRFDDLEAENLKLSGELDRVSKMWRAERDARRLLECQLETIAGLAKETVGLALRATVGD